MAQARGRKSDTLRMGTKELIAQHHSAQGGDPADHVNTGPSAGLLNRPMQRRAWRAACAAFLLTTLAGPISTAVQAQVFTEPTKPTVKPSPKPRTKPRPTTPPRTERERANPTREARPPAFRDPVGYCSAHPDFDMPGAPYSGPPVPDWIAGAMATSGLQQSASSANTSFNWRCMNRRVMACFSPVGKSLCEKPSQDREPTAEMQQYCTGKRKGEVPSEIAGNTVPVWTCKNGKPEIAGYRSGLDPRGYLSGQWSDVTDLSPANMVGSVARVYVGQWNGTISGKGFLFKIPYAVIVNVSGGRLNEKIGSVDYYARDLHGQVSLFCASDLYLSSNTQGRLDLREQFRQGGADGRCPAQERITMQPRDGQVLVEWRKNGDEKIKMSGWVQRINNR